jgi:hypothetical protein
LRFYGDSLPAGSPPRQIDPILLINIIVVIISIILVIAGSVLIIWRRKLSGILILLSSAFSVISIILITIALNEFHSVLGVLIIIPLILLVGGVTALLPEKRFPRMKPSDKGDSDLSRKNPSKHEDLYSPQKDTIDIEDQGL